MLFNLSIFLLISSQALSLATPRLEALSSDPVLSRRDGTRHSLYARQSKEQKSTKTGNNSKDGQQQNNPENAAQSGAGSPAEQAAGQMVQTLLQMGEALEAVTNMGSNTSVVTSGIEATLKMLPEMAKARSAVMQTLSNKDALKSAVSKADSATEKITQILKSIQQTPADANIIKKNFEALGNAFGEIFGAAEGVVNTAFPNANKENAGNKSNPTSQGNSGSKAEGNNFQDKKGK